MKATNMFLAKTVLLAWVLCLGVQASAKEMVSMKAHVDAKVTCNQCHKNNSTNPYVSDSCIACHEETKDRYYRGELDADGKVVLKEYMESGRVRKTSIHDSHGGEIRCTVCHTAHKEPVPLYCNNCHQFEVRPK